MRVLCAHLQDARTGSSRRRTGSRLISTLNSKPRDLNKVCQWRGSEHRQRFCRFRAVQSFVLACYASRCSCTFWLGFKTPLPIGDGGEAVEVRFWCCSDFCPRASQGIERDITSSGICLRCSSSGRNSLGKLPVAASLPCQADGRRDTVVTRHRRCHATAASSDFFCVLSVVQGSTYIVLS